MNNIVELLEMQAELESLIQESIGELTIREYQLLQEAGMIKNIGKGLVKHGTPLAKKVGKYTAAAIRKNPLTSTAIAGTGGTYLGYKTKGKIEGEKKKIIEKLYDSIGALDGSSRRFR